MDIIKLLTQATINIIVVTVSIIVTFIVFNNTIHPGYNLMFLLPLVFSVCFVFFLSNVLFKTPNLFIMVFLAVSFSRYVILPLLIAKTGWYYGRSVVPPTDNNFELAIKLMLYELIVVSIYILFIFKKKYWKLKTIYLRNDNIILPKTTDMYILFLSLAVALILAFPQVLESFSFLIPKENHENIGEVGGIYNYITYIAITAKYILFLVVISYLYKRYEYTNKNIYFYLIFLSVILNIGIIIGGNRSDFIITALASLYLFHKLYPRKGKLLIMISILMIVIITSLITEHRGTVTITKGTDRLTDITDTLQVYLGGPYNVAMALETADVNQEERNFGNLFYDLTRPAIGLNIIMKHLEGFEFSNYLFNKRIFFSDHTSQIIPMIGQGYFYFGFIFAPILFISFIRFVVFLITKISRESHIELIFFLSIPIMRMGFGMGQNAGILINDTSMFLLLSLIIYFLNKKVVIRKK